MVRHARVWGRIGFLLGTSCLMVWRLGWTSSGSGDSMAKVVKRLERLVKYIPGAEEILVEQTEDPTVCLNDLVRIYLAA